MTRCIEFESIFRLLPSDPQLEIPDAMALHLDVCPNCRERFDEGKVELDPNAFESLTSSAQERVLNILRRARMGKGRDAVV